MATIRLHPNLLVVTLVSMFSTRQTMYIPSPFVYVIRFILCLLQAWIIGKYTLFLILKGQTLGRTLICVLQHGFNNTLTMVCSDYKCEIKYSASNRLNQMVCWWVSTNFTWQIYRSKSLGCLWALPCLFCKMQFSQVRIQCCTTKFLCTNHS